MSSDSDFTRLAARLRESGMTVIGMGESKTPNSFISACNKFKYLDILSAAEEEETEDVPRQKQPVQKEKKPAVHRTAKSKAKEDTPKPEPKAAASKKTPIEEPKTGLRTIRRALRSIVKENSEEDEWIFVGKVGNLLGKRYPDFDVRNFGFSKPVSYTHLDVYKRQPSDIAPVGWIGNIAYAEHSLQGHHPSRI